MDARRRPATCAVIATAFALALAPATDVAAPVASPAPAAGATTRLSPTADATVTVSRRAPLRDRHSTRLRIDAARRRGALLRFDLRRVHPPLARATLVLSVAGRARGSVVAQRVDVGP